MRPTLSICAASARQAVMVLGAGRPQDTGAAIWLNNNYEQAKALRLRAMQVNPTDAYLQARSAAAMTYVGEPHFALDLGRSAIWWNGPFALKRKGEEGM